MRLYLAQHGEAEPKKNNPDRPLTVKGSFDVRKIAVFLESAGVRVTDIWHSGKIRARQTAEILAQALKANGNVKQREGLAPNDPVDEIKAKIDNRKEDLLIVGHLPFLAKLASLLITDDETRNVVIFQTGCVLCLERDEDSGWSVCWMAPPDLLT